MFGMRSRNPILNRNRLDTGVLDSAGAMTIEGFINKTGILLALVVFSFSWIWNNPQSMMLLWPALIVAFILSLITLSNPNIAKFTAPAYALCEGVVLGGISRMFELQSKGLVTQAVILTVAVFCVMLFLYRTKIVQVTEQMRMVVSTALGALFFVYLLNFVLNFFGINIPLIFGNGPIGIIFSLFVVGLASFKLILDFDMIEQAIGRASKSMEWYCAFALMVTIVWLYFEILILLAKLNSRR